MLLDVSVCFVLLIILTYWPVGMGICFNQAVLAEGRRSLMTRIYKDWQYERYMHRGRRRTQLFDTKPE